MNMHNIGILALPGFVPFDCSIPFQLFSLACGKSGEHAYDLNFIGDTGHVSSGQFSIEGALPLAAMQEMNTVIVPGVTPSFGVCSQGVLDALRQARNAGIRMASICTGACILAAAGLLDGMQATTHWSVAEELAARYPQIDVEADILFVDNGQVLTSAGLASGIDLCLHMIRQDLGAAAAEELAAFFVVPMERDGGQRQFIRRTGPESGGNLAPLLLWMQENMHKNLTLSSICRQAHMSSRTLNRRFLEQVGAPPMLWLTRARVRRSQALLESSSMSVEEIAASTGFGSAASLRDHFRRTVGTSPTAWRKTFKRYYTGQNMPE